MWKSLNFYEHLFVINCLTKAALSRENFAPFCPAAGQNLASVFAAHTFAAGFDYVLIARQGAKAESVQGLRKKLLKTLQEGGLLSTNKQPNSTNARFFRDFPL